MKKTAVFFTFIFTFYCKFGFAQCDTVSVFPALYDIESETACGTNCGDACTLTSTIWTNVTTDDIDWTVDAGGTTSSNTGPFVDNTLGTAFGNYLYIESSGLCFPTKEAILESNCLDFSLMTAPMLQFYYHMVGATTGDLFVEVNTGGAWTNLLNISGQQQTSQNDPWIMEEIDLSSYSGIVRLRFRGITSTSYTSDIAIDDIVILEKPPTDVGVYSITEPNSGYMLGNTETLSIKIKNYGTDPQDTIPVAYSINGAPQVSDTIFSMLYPGGTLSHSFTTTMDLSVLGSYSLDVWTSLTGDMNTGNDSITDYMISNIEMGSEENFTILYLDDFENNGPSSVFGLNTGSGTGTNSWFINDEYDGLGLYPNTPSQSITGGLGQIGTTDGMYLHINDLTSLASNSNYNPTVLSERWAKMNTGFCTLGFGMVEFNFWWYAKGSSADYGEVYYSANGGVSWILMSNTDGLSKYNNASSWSFSSIKNPDFSNQDDLRFAFKWSNDTNNTNDVHPFSVDDVLLIGYYDDSSTVNINSLNFSPNPVCHEYPGTVTLLIEFTEPLCAPASYLIELSDGNGDWSNPSSFSSFQLDASWSGFVGAINLSGILPISTYYPIDSCYKFRINRVTAPTIIGNEFSGCIEIIDCADSTVTDQPVATMASPGLTQNPGNMPGMPTGQQPVCINSQIIAPFFSYGAFNPGNNYILQLSDSSGSFANPTDIGGPMPETRTYDPALPYMPPSPGAISGSIPVVSEGCNYYLRVISTDPVVDTNAVPWGPFCIKECDILTNDMQNISVCVTNTDTACVPLSIDINSFDPSITYQPGNLFLVQLLAMGPPIGAPMQVMNETYWTYDETESSNVDFCVPILPDYLSIPLQLGTYYMRIVASNSTADTNVLGSLIYFSVGGISSDSLSLSASDDSIICGDPTQISISAFGNYNTNSTFQWYVDGTPIEYFNLSTINLYFGSLPNGLYEISVQETSYNGDTCLGPISDPIYIYVDIWADVAINGPQCVVAGDTATYSVNISGSSTYAWDWYNSGLGTVLAESNNEITIVWSGVGTDTLKLNACRSCGVDETLCNENEIVITIIDSAISHNQTASICEGESILLGGNYQTTSGIYYDTLVNPNGCDSVLSTNLSVDTLNANLTISGNSITANPAGATYQWLDCYNGYAPITGETNQLYTPTSTGSYAAEISLGSCIDTTDCQSISITSLKEDAKKTKLLLYPNPTTGILTIEGVEGKATVYDIYGRMVLAANTNTLDISNAAMGIYFVRVVDKQGKVYVGKVVKE